MVANSKSKNAGRNAKTSVVFKEDDRALVFLNLNLKFI